MADDCSHDTTEEEEHPGPPVATITRCADCGTVLEHLTE